MGISQVGTEFSLITTNIPDASGDVEATDVLIIGDSSNAESPSTTTIGDVLSDLNIVNGISENGLVVRTADNTYESREIEVNSAGNLGGLVIAAGNAVAGNPTIGLDIQNTAPADSVATNDLVIVYDVSTGENRTYTISEIANSASADTFSMWTGAGNTTGDANINAVGGSDEVTISGGAGINIDFNAATQNITFNIVGTGITTSTGVDDTDEIVIFDPATGEATKAPLSTVIDDLDLVTSVVPSTVDGLEGVSVDSTNPEAPAIGLDIDNLDDSDNNLEATDELVMSNGTNNVSVNGQQIAEGVADILGLPEITLSTINGQPVVTIPDATRGDKELSIDSNSFMWSENSLSNNDWIQIAGASDADSGYIMPFDGTIVMSTAHCENADNATTINIYNGASTTPVAAAGSFTASANAQFVNTTLNIDFVQGDRIRLRNVGGSIRDTVVSIFVKWRAS